MKLKYVSVDVFVKMSEKYLIFFLLILFSELVVSKNRKSTPNRFEDFKGEDAVMVIRCDVVCLRFGKTEREKCHEECMKEKFIKHGFCPTTFENLTVFERACMRVCRHDSECPLVEKCCHHSCGDTCQPASGLQDYHTLPLIPVAVAAKEGRGKNVVHLKWKMPPRTNESRSDVLYVVEERHHFGRYYNDHLLGPWTPIFSSGNESATLTNVIKAARWYHFRVASVNVNGTKGFSVPSKEFILSRDPKPRPPRNLRVVNIQQINGTVWGKVRWNPSRSEIPIQRYKIFWSRRLPGIDEKHESDSVYMHRHAVPQNQLYYQLENLEMNKLYFIQVQALAEYGRNRLKSEKAMMSFDTTKIQDQFQKRKTRKYTKARRL